MSDTAPTPPAVPIVEAAAPTRRPKIGGRWHRFWFTPQPASTLTVLRVALGVTTFCWGLSILVDLRTFYFDDGLLPAPNYRDHRLGLFQWFTSDAAVVVVFVALMVSSVLVASGRLVRIAAPVLWLAMLTMQQGAPSALNAGDLLVRLWCTYFALFAVLTPSRFLSVPLFGNRRVDGSRTWPLAPNWFIRIVQIQLTVIYVDTVIAKVPGSTWREGTASLFALGLVDFERFWIPDLLRENLAIGNVMTWFTLGLELSLPFLLWTKRTRRAAIVLGLSMHLGFDYAMRLGFFLWGIVIGYLGFVRPAESAKVLGWLSSRRRRRPPPEGGLDNEGLETLAPAPAGASLDREVPPPQIDGKQPPS